MLESLQDFQDHLHFERVPRWEYTGQLNETPISC
jgi:hypothetical protein